MHATQVLRDIPLFRGLSEESLQRLESGTTVRSIEEGEVYLKAGQPPRGFQVVLSGLLKFYRINKAGKEQIFGYGRPNDVFGVVFISDPYRMMPTNCVARMATELVEVDLATMREVMRSEPQLALAVLAEQSRRYSAMTDLVDQLSLSDAHNRLARWLDKWISENHPDADDGEFLVVLPYTQSEIAAQIGTVREVVSRGFSRMEKEGILKASGKRVTIVSRNGLRRMAEE